MFYVSNISYSDLDTALQVLRCTDESYMYIDCNRRTPKDPFSVVIKTKIFSPDLIFDSLGFSKDDEYIQNSLCIGLFNREGSWDMQDCFKRMTLVFSYETAKETILKVIQFKNSGMTIPKFNIKQ